MITLTISGDAHEVISEMKTFLEMSQLTANTVEQPPVDKPARVARKTKDADPTPTSAGQTDTPPAQSAETDGPTQEPAPASASTAEPSTPSADPADIKQQLMNLSQTAGGPQIMKELLIEMGGDAAAPKFSQIDAAKYPQMAVRVADLLAANG